MATANVVIMTAAGAALDALLKTSTVMPAREHKAQQ